MHPVGTLDLQQGDVHCKFVINDLRCANETPTVDGNPALFPQAPESADLAK